MENLKLIGLRLIFLFLSCLVVLSIHAQNRNEAEPDPTFTPPIIPASPTASELGRYGQTPINLSSGTLNTSIPLYTYKTKNLSVPISLSYSCNGIKVDQISSWVGMGWSLNAGGVITRTIRDGADDIDYRPEFPQNLFIGTPDVTEFLDNATNDENENVDTEPDLFSFNFNGQSGQFVFTRFLQPLLIPYQNLKIETDYFLNPGSGINEFIITTPDGIKYFFGGNGCVEKSKPISTSLCGRNIQIPLITSWYLRKILHPLGDSIIFNYGSNQYPYITGKSQTVQEALSYYAECHGTCYGKGSKICDQEINVITRHLTEISSPGLGEVEFISLNDRQDLNNLESRLSEIIVRNYDNNPIKTFQFKQQFSDESSSHRMFLDTLKINDRSDQAVQKYYFEYNKNIDDLPPRLSFAQDHWGFYNGANDNEDLVPYLEQYEDVFGGIGGNREPNHTYADIGLLSKIVYPTGGYDLIDYEPNTYNTDVLIYPNDILLTLDTIHSDFDHPTIPVTKTSEEIEIFYLQKVHINAGASYDSILGGELYDHLHHKGKVMLFGQNSNDYVVNSDIYVGELFSTEVWLQPGVYYLAVKANRIGMSIFSSLMYGPGEPYYENQNVPTGGNRVKKVTTYDNVKASPQIIRYYYVRNNDLDKSSGYINHNPVYFSTQDINYGCPDGIGSMYTCRYGFLYSSSINNLYEFGSSLITYNNVIQSYGENFEDGGIEHRFQISMDDPGLIIHGNTIAGCSYNNSGWDNAIELSTRTFKNDGAGHFIDVDKTIYHYKIDERKNEKVDGLAVRKNWTPILTPLDTLICDEDPDNDIFRVECNANHLHNWYIGFFIEDYKNPKCIASGNNLDDTTWSICHNRLGDTITFPDNLDNYDVTEYSTYSKWHYIDSTTTIQYDESGINPVVNLTTYFYDNPEHANLSRSITTSSNGDIIKTYYYYPQDYINTNLFEDLLEKNISGIKIDTRNYINDRLQQGEVIKYNDYGQPIEAYQAEEELGTDLNFNNAVPYSYGVKRTDYLYDQTAHLLQTVKKDKNLLTSYEWGYKSQFPISETQNALTNEISSTSFEDETISGWQHADQRMYFTNAHTGTYVVNVNTGNGDQYGPGKEINLVDLSSPQSGFIATVWILSTSTEPYLHIEIKDHWDTHVRVHCLGTGTWELLKVELPQEIVEQYNDGTSKIKVYVGNNSGTSAYFDDIRVHPSDAAMTTYTYDPLIGVTSISSPDNIPVTYEYDGFGRLKLVRDSEKNILQSYDYNYANQH